MDAQTIEHKAIIPVAIGSVVALSSSGACMMQRNASMIARRGIEPTASAAAEALRMRIAALEQRIAELEAMHG